MQRNELETMVREIVADKAEIEPSFDAQARFLEDLGLDSLLTLEIITAIEKRLGLRVPEANYQRMASLDRALDVLEQALDAAK